MKKISSLILVLVLGIMFTFTGCAAKSQTTSNANEKSKTVTFKDSRGVEVTVPKNPKRVVVINNSIAEIVYCLGAGDKIVGISDALKFPAALVKKQRVGSSFNPNIEKIISLKPDIVFGYGQHIKKEMIQKIEASGTKFVALDGFKINSLDNDIKTLGEIFDKQEKANEYVEFINKNLNMIKERVKDIKPEEKVKVYWEEHSDYKSASKGSAGAEMLDIAGVENIAGKEPVAYPQVNKEWIVERNPQVVVKLGTSKLPLGYEEKDTNRIEKYANKIITRTGWNKIDAVKNKKVYIMSNEIGTSTRSVVGIYYLAKWCYPDKFKDLNSERVHKELLEKFYNVKYKGIWTYPNN
ncbi:ABC transporter substrate-binding protein [Clostridium sporogenes]|uniref:ABC transporter substrate-binding protein n=1 Tax=Clostridium botulinum TaxID=1491 RepID=A0A6M0T128_CLOBO|nr:ABC transporter substrate-binding protein [Clostridium sporogenes]NFA59871.1 ABC transporter substrate-binding protein [Clostridium botulinum]NFI74056.1 ABC transporter substrate-binding protein [Clostridium sporogenes]NFL71770.1 ABC transporter substrate-binding protein [Clostridium sporogenes]NFM24626.1 ABC transporter substrate-binding protein [Clostridium sporogenes]NFP61930.1 ABC transporter substrate-binding protein [Clostridium sporogenes]